MGTRKRKKKVKEQERRTQEIGYFNPSLEKFFVRTTSPFASSPPRPACHLLRPFPHILHVLKGEGIDSCSVLFTITTIAEYKSTEATRREREGKKDKFLPNATSQ